MYKYRSLEAWKRAHSALILVLRATDKPNHPRTRNLFDQLRRAVISVEANVVEGYALGTPGLYLRHLRIAFGSGAEAECLLRSAGELGYLSGETVLQIEESLSGAMRTLRGLLRRPSIVDDRSRSA
jgi:four helix bundle protein